MNKVIISGNLTRDPEYNETKSGKSIVRMSVAVNRYSEGVDFFNLIAWEQTALFCDKYLSKGRRVIVEGRLQNNNYEDKDGGKHYGQDLIVERIEIADRKKKENSDDDTPPPDDEDIYPF